MVAELPPGLTVVADRRIVVAESLIAVAADRSWRIVAQHLNWHPSTVAVPLEHATDPVVADDPSPAHLFKCNSAIVLHPATEAAVNLNAVAVHRSHRIVDVQLDHVADVQLDHVAKPVAEPKEKACSTAAMPATETAVNPDAIPAFPKPAIIADVVLERATVLVVESVPEPNEKAF